MSYYTVPAPAAPPCAPADNTRPGSRRSVGIMFGGRYEVFCVNTKAFTQPETWVVQDHHGTDVVGIPALVESHATYDEAVQFVTGLLS